MHRVPIEDSIDLHSFQPREIRIVVEEYLFQALAAGFPEVRIIHGRGSGVQRSIVQSILASHPQVHSFHDAADRGSTSVIFKVDVNKLEVEGNSPPDSGGDGRSSGRGGS